MSQKTHNLLKIILKFIKDKQLISDSEQLLIIPGLGFDLVEWVLLLVGHDIILVLHFFAYLLLGRLLSYGINSSVLALDQL